MNTINLSPEQIKSLAHIIKNGNGIFSTPQSIVENIIHKLNEYARPLNVAFSVPAPQQAISSWELPEPVRASPFGEPKPFSETTQLKLNEAITALMVQTAELKTDRDRGTLKGDTYLHHKGFIHKDAGIAIWEIVNDCVGYTEDQQELARIVAHCEEMELKSESPRYKQCLIDRLVAEGRIYAARSETDTNGKTISWYRAKVA